jgi:hypothetical protein
MLISVCTEPYNRLNSLCIPLSIVLNMPLFTYSNICAVSAYIYTKIGTIQRRLAWPLRKDDTQNREAFHIKKKYSNIYENKIYSILFSAGTE